LVDVLVLFLVNCVREQKGNSASLARASPSHLSESCRTSFLVLARAARSGDLGVIWATDILA